MVVAVPGTPEELTRALRRAAHGTIDAVTEDIGELHFNTAISKLMELTNAIIRARESGLAASEAYVEAVDVLLRLLAPIAPHISEGSGSAGAGRTRSMTSRGRSPIRRWWRPRRRSSLPVQVDGKLRDRLVVTPDTPADEIERLALAPEHVQRYLAGRTPARVVQIPGRLVNVVTPRD